MMDELKPIVSETANSYTDALVSALRGILHGTPYGAIVRVRVQIVQRGDNGTEAAADPEPTRSAPTSAPSAAPDARPASSPMMPSAAQIVRAELERMQCQYDATSDTWRHPISGRAAVESWLTEDPCVRLAWLAGFVQTGQMMQ